MKKKFVRWVLILPILALILGCRHQYSPAVVSPSGKPAYEIVIRNGTVYDEHTGKMPGRALAPR